MQNDPSKIVVLGTGGTLAGAASDPGDNLAYRAAQIGVESIVAAIPALAAFDLQTEQVAQIDSKDMTLDIWRRLAASVAYHVDRSDVAGVVITHGTDTLEESAYLLQRVLAPAKPVVLTAAMRPATSSQSDGAQNLLDAVRVARLPGARGVVASLPCPRRRLSDTDSSRKSKCSRAPAVRPPPRPNAIASSSADEALWTATLPRLPQRCGPSNRKSRFRFAVP